jgi:predicted O-methyltransferase YrrM
MSNVCQDYIEEYIRGVIPPAKGVIKEMEDYARLHGIPIIHPEVAALLETLIMACKCRRILEVGTAIGYSAIVMIKAAGKDAELVTIEINSEMAETAAGYIKKAGLSDRIRIIVGDARERLKSIGGGFDMVFIDAAKGHYREIFAMADDLLNPGGVIICDNVLFRGMVASSRLVKRRKITIVKRMREFIRYISSHPEFKSSVVPIGDGISISVRRPLE